MFFHWTYDGADWVAYLPINMGMSAADELQKELVKIAIVNCSPLSLVAVRPDRDVGVAAVGEAVNSWLASHESLWFPLK